MLDETKNVTLLGGRLSPNSYIIWSDFTQSRFFSHFRYFWGENHKRSIFGRFWSEKVRKTTKSQKTILWTVCDGVTGYKVTTLGANQVNNMKITCDGGFLAMFGDVVMVGRQIWSARMTTSMKAIREP